MRDEIKKEFRLGPLFVTFHWRSKRNLRGRFGGGWNWKLGAQYGGGCLIVSLLIADLRIEGYAARMRSKEDWAKFQAELKAQRGASLADHSVSLGM